MRALGRTLLNSAFLFALVLWGGMVFFFAFVATPVIFADLDRDSAARLLGDLFPRYYRVQLLCIAVALAATLARLAWGAAPRRLAGVAAGLLAIAFALALYASAVQMPRLREAQARVPSFVTTPKEDPTRQAYGQLHRRAMMLNGLTALLGAGALALVAFDPRLLASVGRGPGSRLPVESAEQERTEERAERSRRDSLPARARS